MESKRHQIKMESLTKFTIVLFIMNTLFILMAIFAYNLDLGNNLMIKALIPMCMITLGLGMGYINIRTIIEWRAKD
jgi:hypothetical protein